MSNETPRNDAVAKAQELGLFVIEADDLTLFLDIDSEHDFNLAKLHLNRLHGNKVVESAEWCHSKSKHWHVRARLTEPLPIAHRIALQAICGSDRAHELAAWDEKDHECPILLFWTGEPFTPIKLG